MPQAPSSLAPHQRGPAWLLAAAVVVLLLAGAGAAWWFSSADATVRCATVSVTRGPVTRTVRHTGTVNPVMTIIVGSYVPGVIQQVSCDYNTQVKKGQVCAKIDPRPYQSVVDQNAANLDIAKAQLEKDRASPSRSNRGATLRVMSTEALRSSSPGHQYPGLLW